MNGIDATKEIRSFEKEIGLDNIPIIGLTAGVISMERDACLQAGMQECVSKPLEREQIVELMNKYS